MSVDCRLYVIGSFQLFVMTLWW